MLHVHRAQRADGLVQALRDLLAQPPPDPFAQEVVSVPTRGMERWLSQRMSDGLGTSAGRADGVCANVAFPSPRRLVGDAVALASGIDAERDPWLPEHALWPLLDVVDACLDEPWLASLARHLGGPGPDPDPVRRARRLATLRHVAELFDRYALHRPAMVRGWAAGDDGALDAAHRWQPELWRRLRARIGVPDLAERVDAACARLREQPGLLELPDRLGIFGLTRLPAGHLGVLEAIATARDVHLFLLHPSPGLWERIARSGPPRVTRRRDDPTAELAENRLLASWGADAREMQLALAGAKHAAHHHPVEQRADTLLGLVQSAVHADREPPGEPLPATPDARAPLAPTDRSIEVHACHGRARQVEVLRDAILHVLDEDQTLEPRDVIVMCPDIETYASLIQATFGTGEAGVDDADADVAGVDARPTDLRVRLADRALRQTNPVLGVVARLIELAGERVTASQVLDLVDREPVRRRFELDDDDLARIESWIAESGIRWGLDAGHRAPFHLERLAAGTWSAGLDRVLVGVAMTEERRRLLGGVLPLDDVDSSDIVLAGRFAELVDRLGAALDALAAAGTVERWTAAIAAAVDALATTGRRDAWQRAELDRILADVVREAGASATELALPEVRALLADRLQGRPTRANFRTGHLTICTLMPMRSVPHRVVCLLGMDEGVFPRRSPRDGDDLMLRDPHVGDRDPRSEDRQLLLDALLSATDRLVVTYTGNDERTNAQRPPAVPVTELLDVVDRTVRTEDGAPASGRVLVRHPLQPFDPRNFRDGALAGDAPWSFDAVTLRGAQALEGPRRLPAPFLPAPLPARAPALVELDDLVRFAERPARAFLRQRLGMAVTERADDVADALSVELDGLEEWGVGNRIVEGLLAGAPVDACWAAEVARGALPPGRLALPVGDRVRPVAVEIARAALEVVGQDPEPGSVDVRVTLPGGRELGGTVAGVCGDVLRTVTYSRLSARHRLAVWVRLLALSAARPDRPFEAVTVGRARRDAADGARITVARIRPIGAERARLGLARLVDLWDRGMREPLPIACLTSAAYAAARAEGTDAEKAARAAWTSEWRFAREDAEPEHQLVFGGVLALERLMAAAPAAGEAGVGWDDAEPTRFGRLARRLWDGVLVAEELTDR